jgi:hypothetical protein
MDDHLDDIAKQLKEAAHILYRKNPRIKLLTITANTVMGVSVTYESTGDKDSPYCQYLLKKEAKENEAQSKEQTQG